ncbi:MAG: indolepyruvate ferredoxin oxidoreductase family protein [Minwuiales bacterium]|nr:indolepyruvate ferredoxin oxidoreductase family protein [Minwuiales bacterium]
MSLAAVSLDDKYALESGRVYLTGIQALVRLPLMQRQRDAAAGFNTAGFISGYRGSPLGGYDQALWRAKQFLDKQHIHFEPGINEDLAATAVWGTQQVNMFQGASYDGVFAMWYGKGPGVDRSGDVFRHGNAAGTSPYGGVLAIAGDDHGAVSSTLPHQTEHNFASWMMPVLHPATVQEYLDFGLLGFAMSRYSGCWVGFTAVSETVESSASVYVDPHRLEFYRPDFVLPQDGLNIRWSDNPMEQEYRLQHYKLYAALAFARANDIDRTVIDTPKPRLGIITTGKSYLDVRQALEDLGIDDDLAAEIGLRVYKVGMTWPLEPEGARHFAEGLEEVIVVEEKRALIENQLKEQLYNWREDVRPRVVGKFDENRQWLLPPNGELTPARIARVIAARIGRFYTSPRIDDRLAFLEAKERQLDREPAKIVRTPYFCSGCPHNSSTKVPEGSRAMAGIGCHYMATWMNRETSTFTQMGGEGVPWIGQAPFTEEKHVFANLGDGTYYHSGTLAVRACVAAKVNITFKLLYNDAAAMTGGQPVEGGLTVPQIARQVANEGVAKVVVVSDEPDKYPANAGFPAGLTPYHRDELESVQQALRDTEGVTVLIYDQTCAAEKRRRRKRGQFPDPAKRVFINELVCEGCGDCSVKSNCVSVEPKQTEFGRKRRINQSSCNKDFSCVNGFCPSFVTVHGGQLKKNKAGVAEQPDDALGDIPLPEVGDLTEPHRILVTGIGGTGVVTIGALLGMAAHIEGRGVSVLDQTGLAQKGGAVMTHVQIAPQPEDLNAVRIAAGRADVLLGCDMVVAGSFDARGKLQNGATRAVINDTLAPTADFTLDPDARFGGDYLKQTIRDATGDNLAEFVPATRLATALMGDAIATNLFMLGYAFQRGLIPISLEALERAIELNGVAVENNKRTLHWGRQMAHDPSRVQAATAPVLDQEPEEELAVELDDIVAKRVAFLTDYQDSRYARRYSVLVAKARQAEQQRAAGFTGLAEAVARYYFKLLAYKDEYEVARLYTSGQFMRQIEATFEGEYRLKFHLAPPLLAQEDLETGHPRKREFGPWMLKAFGFLARFRRLRGTPLDIFGYTQERRQERHLISEYEAIVGELLDGLNTENHGLAVRIAEIPERVRGYGHVKERHLTEAKALEKALLSQFRNPVAHSVAAE